MAEKIRSIFTPYVCYLEGISTTWATPYNDDDGDDDGDGDDDDGGDDGDNVDDNDGGDGDDDDDDDDDDDEGYDDDHHHLHHHHKENLTTKLSSRKWFSLTVNLIFLKLSPKLQFTMVQKEREMILRKVKRDREIDFGICAIFKFLPKNHFLIFYIFSCCAVGQ